ncbi:MAG: hypothetical protein MN733_17275, partial [Nitrososphaera sp.]|nr:hypothetical protein [Nitrososphaera sp.]
SLDTASRLKIYTDQLSDAGPGDFFLIYTLADGSSYMGPMTGVDQGPIEVIKLSKDPAERVKTTITPRTLSDIARIYPWKENVKAVNGDENGVQKRLNLRIASVRYIGKETNFMMEDIEGVDGELLNEGTNAFKLAANAVSMVPVDNNRLANSKVSISWRLQYLFSGSADKAIVGDAIMQYMNWEPGKLKAALQDPNWYDTVRDAGARGRWVGHKDFKRFCDVYPKLCKVAGLPNLPEV